MFVGQFCVSFQVLIMAYVSVWITQELDNQHGIRDTRFIWGNACEGERVGAGVQRERLQSDVGLTSVKGERKGQPQVIVWFSGSLGQAAGET